MLREHGPAVVGLRNDSAPHPSTIFRAPRGLGTRRGRPPRGLRVLDRKEQGISTLALVLVLVAAGVHAGWNLLAKTASGGAAFVWLGAVTALAVGAPALVVALMVAPGELGADGVAFMAGSGVLHAIYFVLLQRGATTGPRRSAWD